MRGWGIITFIQPRQVISDEAEGRVGYQLARLNKSDNRLSSNLITVLSANWSKKFWSKKFWSKIFFKKKFWLKKIFNKQIFKQKKILITRNFWLKINFCWKNSFGQKMLVEKILVKKFFGQKKFWPKNFGQKKILVKKIFGQKKIFVQKKIWRGVFEKW